MSPRLTFILAFFGVLAAGAPLLPLTAPVQHASADPSAAPSATQMTHVSLRFTGKPESATLRFEGEDIATMPADCLSPWELDIPLPAGASIIELEAEIHWPENAPKNAVTITLEPPGLAGRSDTQWTTNSGGNLLHAIFSFTWQLKTTTYAGAEEPATKEGMN